MVLAIFAAPSEYSLKNTVLAAQFLTVQAVLHEVKSRCEDEFLKNAFFALVEMNAFI